MGEITTFVWGLGFWNWFIVGLLLMISELTAPGVFIVWVGLAAVATGVVAFFAPTLELSVELVIFSGFSLAFVFMGWFVYGKVFGKSSEKALPMLNEGARDFIGKLYPLVEALKDGQGKVKVGDTVWLVRSDEKINVGEMVRVKDVDGIVLIVKKGDK